MLTQRQLDRVVVVLVRARNPANIGAVARAMHDFGFRHLRVVNEFPVPFEAARSAVDASAVLADAVGYSSLAEAVADCTLVVGTTAVGERALEHPLETLAQAAPALRASLERPDRNPAAPTRSGSDDTPARPILALLFGSEKTGLSNDELSYCQWLLTIPMHSHEGLRHASMNLGQAVAVCLYELVREDFVTDSGAHGSAATAIVSTKGTNVASTMTSHPHNGQQTTENVPATSASLERVTTLLTEIMEKTEYTRRHAANCAPAHVRRLVRRIGIDEVDAPIWMGIFRQILWKLNGGRGDQG